MCIGYMQILHHLLEGTQAPLDFGILKGSWNQTSADIKG